MREACWQALELKSVAINNVCAGVCILAWYLTVSSAARSAEWLWDVGCNLMV